MNCPACKGESCTEIREKVYVNGQRGQWHQCMICGGNVGGALKKSDWIANPKPFDESLQRDESNRRWQHEQETRADQARADSAAWFKEHDAYLQTDAWKALRRKVIDRESGLCQGCRDTRGAHVHHLTYARWKRELLIDLVLLCEACHDLAHEKREQDIRRSA